MIPVRSFRFRPAVRLALFAVAVGAFAATASAERAFDAPRVAARPKAAAAASSANSSSCAGLANYEIVRSQTGTAACLPGNHVLGGSCEGINNGAPNADGTAWTCDSGEPATAICALVCSFAPPRSGACCTEAGCVVLTSADCIASGGQYLGDDTACGPQSCATTGACCITDEQGRPGCVEGVTQGECEGDFEGFYVGDGLACDSDDAAICF